MSDNAKPTPVQALDILKQIGAHPTLKLSLQEHGAVQQALQVIDETLNPKSVAPLTVVP